MMIVSTGFAFNDEHSESKYVTKIRIQGGLIQDSFLANRSVDAVRLRNSYKTQLRTIEREPLVIPMALYFDENLTEENIRIVKRWLDTDDYKSLRFDEDPGRIYYAIVDGASTLSHNAISSGYVEFDMLTNSPYSFSDIIEVEGSSTSTQEREIRLHNDGDLEVSPKIEVVMNSKLAGTINITNETIGQHLVIENNLANETVTILNEYEEIHTTSTLQNKYSNHNGAFISLTPGENVLKFKGMYTFKLSFQSIYK